MLVGRSCLVRSCLLSKGGIKGAGSREYPLLESNSDFFVLLEPYSEIFDK